MIETNKAAPGAISMKSKSWIYYISKVTLIDEILGFAYWALSIYGIFLISRHVNSSIVMAIILSTYVILVVIFYIFIIKKIKSFFKGGAD